VAVSPHLRRAARVLRSGGVIAYPTEAVFGLGCDPACRAAVTRIASLKGRPSRAGFILIAAGMGQLDGWIAPTPAEQRRLAQRTSRPVTWVVTAGPRATPALTGGRKTLAIRVTAHPVAAALCRAAAMPLVSTSANIHGRPPARTALAARRRLGRRVDLVVPGATGGHDKPTEIRDARTGAVLRP
jgi:L-threonylcarbamoyladenylate synthase